MAQQSNLRGARKFMQRFHLILFVSNVLEPFYCLIVNLLCELYGGESEGKRQNWHISLLDYVFYILCPPTTLATSSWEVRPGRDSAGLHLQHRLH